MTKIRARTIGMPTETASFLCSVSTFSVFCFGAAIWRHLNPGPPPPVPDVKRIPHYVLITVNGFLALVSLAALIAIWFTPLD
jgi:hypothetical protein